MLLCPSPLFLAEAKLWQRRSGGNSHTLLYEVVDCERGFNENICTFERKWKKMEDVVQAVTTTAKDYMLEDGTPVVSFLVDPPTCCQGRVRFRGYTAKELDDARDVVQDKTNVRMYNNVVPKQTLDQKMEADRDAAAEAEGKGQTRTEGQPELNAADEQEDDRDHMIEWMMMSVTEKVPTEQYVEVVREFCRALRAQQKT